MKNTCAHILKTMRTTVHWFRPADLPLLLGLNVIVFLRGLRAAPLTFMFLSLCTTFASVTAHESGFFGTCFWRSGWDLLSGSGAHAWFHALRVLLVVVFILATRATVERRDGRYYRFYAGVGLVVYALFLALSPLPIAFGGLFFAMALLDSACSLRSVGNTLRTTTLLFCGSAPALMIGGLFYGGLGALHEWVWQQFHFFSASPLMHLALYCAKLSGGFLVVAGFISYCTVIYGRLKYGVKGI